MDVFGFRNIFGLRDPLDKEVEILIFKSETKRNLLKESLAKDKDDVTSMDSEDLKMIW